MKSSPHKTFALLVSAAFFLSSGLRAATTDPVGYVSLSVNAYSDARLGIPLTQSAVFSGSVGGVSAGTITVDGTVPDVTTSPHFVMITTDGGSLEGNWYQVTGYTATTITVAEDLSALGLTASDTV
ncbi:MAG: hypothetical protein ACPG3X_08360, partial [Opitutales bacterium]